jgi:non-ribosomal peptide synthetase component F
MTDPWNELIHGPRWLSSRTLWVEDGTEYTWDQVDGMARRIEAVIGGARTVRILSASKVGCFAGQLAAWRAGCVAVADNGRLGPSEIDRVRPDTTVTVRPAGAPVVSTDKPDSGDEALPAEVVAVNFTSGSTGSRKVVAVTRDNLVALFGCRGLDVPADGGLVAGSFATPTFDGWWFDTWWTVAAGGTVVCLPGVNEDMFAWPELAEKYGVHRVLLPAAVIATVVEALPTCLADIPWVFSGGEQFRASTVRRARAAELANRFVNLYGPTEATFATHGYPLPMDFDADTIPIGRPLDGCDQTLTEMAEPGTYELVVGGPFVCLGYIERGTLTRRFDGTYRTRDIVRVLDGELVYAGRLDSQIKVSGMRVDAADLERRVTELPTVLDCRVVQDGPLTVACVRADRAVRPRIESVVKEFSPAIKVYVAEVFPMKTGGKVDTAALVDQYRVTDKDGQT